MIIHSMTNFVKCDFGCYFFHQKLCNGSIRIVFIYNSFPLFFSNDHFVIFVLFFDSFANDNKFSWTVGEELVGSACSIEIQSASGFVYPFTSAPFIVDYFPQIIVNVPSVMRRELPYTITWEPKGAVEEFISSIVLSNVDPAKLATPLILASDISMVPSTLEWTVPSSLLAGSGYQLEVKTAAVTSTSSPSFFEIAPLPIITVTTVNDYYYRGSKITISWNLDADMTEYNIKIDLMGFGFKVANIGSTTNLAGDNSLQWTIPSTTPVDEGYQIKVYGKNSPVEGFSNEFRITVPPVFQMDSLPTSILQGWEVELSWKVLSGMAPETVGLTLLNVATDEKTPLVASVDSSQSYAWVVTVPAAQYKIEIYATEFPLTTFASDSFEVSNVNEALYMYGLDPAVADVMNHQIGYCGLDEMTADNAAASDEISSAARLVMLTPPYFEVKAQRHFLRSHMMVWGNSGNSTLEWHAEPKDDLPDWIRMPVKSGKIEPGKIGGPYFYLQPDAASAVERVYVQALTTAANALLVVAGMDVYPVNCDPNSVSCTKDDSRILSEVVFPDNYDMPYPEHAIAASTTTPGTFGYGSDMVNDAVNARRNLMNSEDNLIATSTASSATATATNNILKRSLVEPLITETECPNSCSGHGVCDRYSGECSCMDGYIGDTCSQRCCAENCNYNGMCYHVSGSCSCGFGYYGETCAQRFCQYDCSGHGTCLSDGSCDCDDGWLGDGCYIEELSCKDPDCSGHGTCDNGICFCDRHYDGESCETEEDGTLSTEYQMYVEVVWGIAGSGSDTDDYPNGKPKYDGKFDLYNPEVQQFLYDACDEIANNSDLKITYTRCVIKSLQKNMASAGKNFPTQNEEDVQKLREYTLKIVKNYGKSTSEASRDIGVDSSTLEPIWMRFKYRVNVDKDTVAAQLEPYYDMWDDAADTLDAKRPSGFSKMNHISQEWVRMFLELEVISGAITAWAISNGCAFISIFIFTRNFMVAVITTFCIVGIVTSLLAFMVYWMGWTFGAVEAIAVTVFVGSSVDYCLHIGHSYNEAKFPTKFQRARSALRHTGVSVFSAFVTTFGSAGILLFCILVLFQQFGIIIAANTLFSIVAALVFFPAFMMGIGPTVKRKKLRRVSASKALKNENSGKDNNNNDDEDDDNNNPDERTIVMPFNDPNSSNNEETDGDLVEEDGTEIQDVENPIGANQGESETDEEGPVRMVVPEIIPVMEAPDETNGEDFYPAFIPQMLRPKPLMVSTLQNENTAPTSSDFIESVDIGPSESENEDRQTPITAFG
eukprot:TRINITY_DN431_c0_g1_i4.p1 TRINITY_DN431_c0_g1~~TRINITY_DN431_c0_g1_i4.p1  ORF type:complete len:1281 (-),score=405.32 TRINITY_DN431_c0_g1_i4:529-4371(-)